MDDAERKMLETILGPAYGPATLELLDSVGFELPAQDAKPWVEFVEWTNKRPPFIARWRADAALERRRYGRFTKGISDCRDAYSGALYHLRRLSDIEARVRDILERHDLAAATPPNTVAGLPQAKSADFEYQAFLFAYRRSLEYLAWGLSTYFGCETDSFKKFEKVGRWQPEPVAKAMEAAYQRHVGRFAFVLSDGRGRSVRDRLAHKDFVASFHINVTRRGPRLFTTELPMERDPRSLTDLLVERLADLHACITDMLFTFRRAVTELEGEGNYPALRG